ncbi:MAG: hypothetical protein H6709_12360 [Kofleriaceae bacterium]|nr:hypothetical protein [Myxococcales bacterium]MCB9563636.1 hypothetical protein [Kofleriaceae bacterium]MCB9572871.1 hypothetical protein [Kofleriaceae bacterium]
MLRPCLPVAVLLVAASLGAAACKHDTHYTDAGVRDAGDQDGGSVVPDARPPLPAYEITGGARGVAGARFKADVQIGHGVGQQPATGNGTTAEGNAAVKP